MTLRQFEKFHRKFYRTVPPSVTNKECLITFAVVLLTAPFLYSAFFMIPFIGQLLFIAALVLTAIYLYTRKSFKISAIIVFGHLLFLIPSLVAVQMIAVKNRFDVTLFFLIVGCIPVTIFYILLIAGRTWFLVETGQEKILANNI